MLEDDCIEWWAGKQSRGYGCLYRNGKQILAHRHIYAECFGPIPDGMEIRHRCVNPNHLIVGTHKQNMEDMVERGRMRKPISTRCWRGHEHLAGEPCRKCSVIRTQNYRKRRAQSTVSSSRSASGVTARLIRSRNTGRSLHARICHQVTT